MNFVLESLVKLLQKQMLEKKRSETLLKIISYVEISQKRLAKQLCSERTSCVMSQATNMDILTCRQHIEENLKTEI